MSHELFIFLDGAFDEDLEIKKQQLKAQKFEEEYKKKKPSKLKPRFVYLTILCNSTKKKYLIYLFSCRVFGCVWNDPNNACNVDEKIGMPLENMIGSH